MIELGSRRGAASETTARRPSGRRAVVVWPSPGYVARPVRMVRRGAVSLVACLAGSLALGCTVPARIATLERDNGRLQEQVTSLQARVAQLEERVGTIGKRLGTANGKNGRRSVEQRLGPIEQRLGMMEQERDDGTEAARAAAEPSAVRTSAPTPRPPQLPELDLEGLRRESARDLPAGYRRGIDRIRSGAYEEAIQALRDFVRVKHDSAFAVGAHYWIGQSYMQLGQFYQAILAFTEAQQRAPTGAYAAGAGLASGIAFQQLGNGSEARRAFEKVIADAPDSPEAVKARVRLAELGAGAR